MTREEAINWLNFIKYHVENKIMATFDDDSEDAIDMAIEALKSEIVQCKDCKWYDKFPPIHTKCRCKLAKWWCNDMDYCSYGERREP